MTHRLLTMEKWLSKRAPVINPHGTTYYDKDVFDKYYVPTTADPDVKMSDNNKLNLIALFELREYEPSLLSKIETLQIDNTEFYENKYVSVPVGTNHQHANFIFKQLIDNNATFRIGSKRLSLKGLNPIDKTRFYKFCYSQS